MGYEHLKWDSEFFGFSIARVAASDEASLADTVDEADANGIHCLYLLCPSAEVTKLHAALKLGFKPYDLRVELSCVLPRDWQHSLVVRDAEAADETTLQKIAGERLSDTRFWADGRFPRDRVRDLYVEWLRRGMSSKPMRRTLVVGDPDGFVTCHFDGEREVGAIELIAVAAGREGTGLGDALMVGSGKAFEESGLRRAEVVTQGRNIAAQRLYQKHGYRTERVDVWLHRWNAPR